MRLLPARPLAAAALVLAAALPAQSNTERVANDQYGRSHDYDLVHERIELRNFDWDSTSFDGSVAVTLRALRPAFDSVVLDAGHLLAVSAVKDRAGALAFAAHGDTLVVRLRKAVAFGDTVRFSIAYHGVVENGRGLTFIEEDAGPPRRPQQIWSQGEAENNHFWFPTYDHPNDRLTWEIVVTAKKAFTVVSNGRLLSDVANKDGTHTAHWSQELPASSYLASIVVAPLAKLHDSWKGRPVDYYVYPWDTTNARRLFRITPDQIAVFSRLTGVDYPWPKYAQTTVADFFGGMENVSATTLVDWIPDPTAYLDNPWYHSELIAHELAHQWFGDWVTTASWAHLWLNEGWATFMVAPYLATKGGPHASQDYFTGKYDEFMGSDRRKRMPVAALESNNIYPKGGLVLEMLRHYLGDERFWAGTHRYLVDHADGLGTTDDFRQAMLAATGENLDWFFDQWLYQAGYPEFKVVSSADSAAHRLTLLVQQVQPDTAPADSTGFRFTTPGAFRMPVTIVAGTTGGDVRQTVWIDHRMHTIVFDSLPGTVTSVIFDEGNGVLKTLTFDEPTRWLAAQLERDPDLWNRRWVIQQLTKRPADTLAAAALAKAATSADYYLTRLQAARALGGFPTARAFPSLVAALADTSARVRAMVLGSLGRLGGDSALALARTAFEKDPSYDVRAAAFTVVAQTRGAVTPALLARALATPSYQDVIGDAALRYAAQSGDTSAVALVNAQVGKLSDALYVLAALGNQGSAGAYALVASRLDDPRASVRHTAGQALLFIVPKDVALQLIAAEEPKLTRARARAEVVELKKRIERRAARVR